MNLSELEQLAKAATPGPWAIGDDSNDAVWCVMSGRDCVATCSTETGLHIADATFIAAANPETILRLIELLRDMAGALIDASNDYPKEKAIKALAKYEEMTK